MTQVSDLFTRMPGGHFEAGEWGRRYADDLGHAWAECPRADWLLWGAAILEVDHATITSATLACARWALELLPEAEDEARLEGVLALADRWCRGEATADECRESARQVLAIYQGGKKAGRDQGHALAGYATSAVAAAVLVPTYNSVFGRACGASAAALAAAQVAAPYDETVLYDAHSYCAKLVRDHIPFEAVVGSSGFKVYARSLF
ncbi:MAG: hypothetical protein JKY65_21080 [Planctomycetes bacterium]|nr:hypothetical protein [Planctomycetota bacterium]